MNEDERAKIFLDGTLYGALLAGVIALILWLFFC
jgi:hypothetical protein